MADMQNNTGFEDRQTITHAETMVALLAEGSKYVKEQAAQFVDM